MDYNTAIQFIKRRREQALIDAERVYNAALDDAEFYDVEKQLREAHLSGNKAQIEHLSKRRNEALKRLGITSDQLTPPFRCTKCNDSGVVKRSTPCSCVVKMTAAAAAAAYSGIPLNSFEKTDFNFYGEKTDEIKKLAERLETFCEKFPSTTFSNLCLIGNTGTGKTYLASCVADSLIKKGASVVFISAFNLVNCLVKFHTTFDERKFSYINPFLDCTMLIIDDLGTEEIFKNITIEYLYHILNERQIKGLHTMITSNLSRDKLEARYGARITSRLFDKTKCFVHSFTGADLRWH